MAQKSRWHTINLLTKTGSGQTQGNSTQKEMRFSCRQGALHRSASCQTCWHRYGHTSNTRTRARAHTQTDRSKQQIANRHRHTILMRVCVLRFALCVLRFMQALREHTTHTEPPPPMLPAAAAAADSSSDMAAPVQLPSGWSEHVSGSTGETYATQHNTATQNRHNIFP